MVFRKNQRADGKSAIVSPLPKRGQPASPASGQRMDNKRPTPVADSKGVHGDVAQRKRVVTQALLDQLPDVLVGLTAQYVDFEGDAVAPEADAFAAAADGYAKTNGRDVTAASRCETAKSRLRAFLEKPSAETLRDLSESAHRLEVEHLIGPIVAKMSWNPEWEKLLGDREKLRVAQARPERLNPALCQTYLIDVTRDAFATGNTPLLNRLFELFPPGDNDRERVRDRDRLIVAVGLAARQWTESCESIDFVLDRVADERGRSALFARCAKVCLKPEEMSHLCKHILAMELPRERIVHLARGLVDWGYFSRKSEIFHLADWRTLEARKAFRALQIILDSALPDADKLARQFLGTRELSRLVEILTRDDAVGVTGDDLDRAIDVVKRMKAAPWMQLSALNTAKNKLETIPAG